MSQDEVCCVQAPGQHSKDPQVSRRANKRMAQAWQLAKGITLQLSHAWAGVPCKRMISLLQKHGASSRYSRQLLPGDGEGAYPLYCSLSYVDRLSEGVDLIHMSTWMHDCIRSALDCYLGAPGKEGVSGKHCDVGLTHGLIAVMSGLCYTATLDMLLHEEQGHLPCDVSKALVRPEASG